MRLVLNLSVCLSFYLHYLAVWQAFVVQLLDDEPFEALRPTLENLLADTEPDKQRGSAELLAGVIGGKLQYELSRMYDLNIYWVGSKHWPSDAQRRLWVWFTPFIRKIFSHNIKTDTLMIWTSFLEVRHSILVEWKLFIISAVYFLSQRPSSRPAFGRLSLGRIQDYWF
jgi:hypothetical protein